MTQVVIGNIIALIASILMVLAGLQKKKKKILFIQIVQIALSVISNLVLGGYTGAIINALSCVRDILCYKDKMGTKEKIIIIILAVGLSVAFNNLGWIGLLPLIATVVYITFMNTKDVVKFKLLIIFSMVMWLIYDLYIKSYTSGVFDFMSVIANIVAILQIKRYNYSKNGGRKNEQ
ncbi:MAG: YgjV family protein [Clostridia bacterium]|nr:YgjV family protein [Clostridia bacterium]